MQIEIRKNKSYGQKQLKTISFFFTEAVSVLSENIRTVFIPSCILDYNPLQILILKLVY